MDLGRTGLMGGSYNPVHNGHIAVAQSFLNSTYIDKLWVLLTPQPPHKTESPSISYAHRMQMLKLAFEDYDLVHISDFENSLPKPSYTFKTIASLKKTYSEEQFMLCIGEDSLANFTTWFHWQEILEQVPLLVASRPGFKVEELHPKILEQTQFVDHASVAISSTAVREKIAKQVEVDHLIPDSVASYIRTHNLYV